MIYATNSIRAINSYCADIYEENNNFDTVSGFPLLLWA